MSDDKNTKQRIFEAAATLFAQKGYGHVGIREIVKKAGANIAMINYYFGGKVGILKEIIEVTFRNRNQIILKYYKKKGSIEERTRSIIRGYIELMRGDPELALVAFSTKTDDKEIIELQEKLSRESYEMVKDFFDDLGLDLHDFVQGVSLGGIMHIVVLNHFRALYDWSVIDKKILERFNDKFYEQYIEILAQFYLHGVTGVVKNLTKKGKKSIKKQSNR